MGLALTVLVAEPRALACDNGRKDNDREAGGEGKAAMLNLICLRVGQSPASNASPAGLADMAAAYLVFERLIVSLIGRSALSRTGSHPIVQYPYLERLPMYAMIR